MALLSVLCIFVLLIKFSQLTTNERKVPMKNHEIAERILGEQRISLVIAGEESKLDMLRAMLKIINSSVICNKTFNMGCRLTVHIPSMGVESMRQRTVSALHQSDLDIQFLNPLPVNDHENSNSPK